MDDWRDVPIVEILQERLAAPVMLPNSMAAKVRAVDRLEVEGDVRNLLYVEYGDGISCGMKLGGEYLVGDSNMAGELGHLRITDRQVPCRCGSVGCLEAVAALPGLARNVKEALTDNTTTELASLGNLTGTDVLLATAGGDRLALRVVEEAFDYLGRAVAGVVNILDPSTVILDNRLMQAGDDAVNSLQRSLTRNVSPFHSAKLQLSVSKVESHIGAIGGGVTVIDHCLED
ncbi:MAG: ROK family protein, partial [Phycisphaerae bacterium]|nr:ROK family protein [Phycisphaerae bacterium]